MKKVKRLFILIIMLPFLIGCHSFSASQDKIFDDDSLIVKEGDSYTYKDRLGGFETNLEPDTSRIVEIHITLEYSKFYGKETFFTITVNEQETMSLNVISTTTGEGRLKFCWIHPDQSITIIFTNTFIQSLSQVLEVGKNRFALVGYDANGSLTMDVDTSAITGLITTL